MTAGDLFVVAEASYRGCHTLVDQRPFPSDSPPPAVPSTSNFLQPLYTVPPAVAMLGGDCLD